MLLIVCTRCAVAQTYGTLMTYDRYICKTFRAVYRLPLAVTEANADSLAVTEANADSLAVTEANVGSLAVMEALHTQCDQP